MDWAMIFSGWAAAMGTGTFALAARVALRQERHSEKIKVVERDVGELKETTKRHRGQIEQLLARKARA